MMPLHSLILVYLLFCWTPCASAFSPASDENIHINADSMSQISSAGEYRAEGNVLVVWNGSTLTANQVRYVTATRTLRANGSVVLIKGTAVLKGDTLVMDMESGRAEMDATQLTVADAGMTMASEKLLRISESEFSATSTELTTCDMPDPSWKFGADKLDVNLHGYATGRNVLFYVKEIPVLYLPWIAFPVVMEKRSGLLFPRFGYSKSRGAQLDIPAYWVISPSQDLLLDLDILSRRGVATGVDYRYIRKRGSEGHISLYPIYDTLEDRWRWQLAQEHKEIFSDTANLRMTVNATSDRTFLNDYGEKSGDYNRQTSDTTINALKTWQNYAVNSYLRYNEDLYAADNRVTVQTLPALGLAGVRQQMLSLPLYFDLDSTIENLARESAPSGQRLHLFPRLTLLPFRSGFLQASVTVGAHVRGYSTDRRYSTTTEARDGNILPEAGVRLSTSLARVYDTNAAQFKKIRHEIIPEFSFGYMPERDQQRLPLYDFTDRMIQLNTISLSATNLLSGKFVSGDTAEYREISRIRLSAEYMFEGERRDLLTLVESQHQWSDLSLESDTWLTKLLRMTFDTRYDLYEKRLSTAVAGVQVDDRLGNSAGVAYRMAHNEVEYFEGRVATKLIKPFNLGYTARYSFDRSDFLESVYSAEYRHKCWSVNLAMHQRPGNQSYMVNFNLAALGGK
jgi:LPS-assembly protein